MATLSEILNARIGKGGKSKASVADHLGVSERTIENYMKGKRQPKPDALVELSKFLAFDLSEMSEQFVPNKEIRGNGRADTLDTFAVPKSEVRDKYIQLLEDNLKEKKDQLKELQARLSDLEGRQRDFLAKVEDSIERYEHLVLSQLQNSGLVEQSTLGSNPTVLQQVYKKGGKAQKKSS